MVYTPRMSEERIAAAQNDLDRSFEQLKNSKFMQRPKPKGQQTCVQANGRTARTVVVETRKPRVSEDELRQRRIAEDTAKREKLLAEGKRKRDEAEAKRILYDLTAPLRQRIAAAEFLGFAVSYRGPEEQPRRIILRHQNKERIVIEFPRGKNARKQISHLRLH